METTGAGRNSRCWQIPKQRLQYPGEDHKHNVVEVDSELDNKNAGSQTRRVGDCEPIVNEKSKQEKCDTTQVEDALNLRVGKCNGPETLRN